jgi:glycine hydroxymethyltransferase
VTSGLRLGTPAVTSRGFGPEEMSKIARFMYKTITNLNDSTVTSQVKEEVEAITSKFPVPGIDY